MDERANVRNIAAAVGDVLRSISDAGFELRRTSHPTQETTEVNLFDELITSEPIREASRALFRDRHYARAVEEAFKCLNNAVRDKSGLASDGASLMRSTFSPNNPRLMLNGMQTQSERDEQQGYMDIYAGALTGIRNPRAHDHLLADTPENALQMIVLANHLMGKLDGAVPNTNQALNGE